MDNKNLNEEEISRILNEHRASKSKLNAETNKKGQKGKKPLDGEERFDQWLDKILSKIERPLNYIGEKYDHFHDEIYYPFWQRLVKWVSVHRFSPYILDYVYGVVRYFVCLSIAYPFIFLLFLMFNLISPRGIGDVFIISIAVTYGIWFLMFVLMFVVNSSVWLYLIDILTFKRTLCRHVEMRIVRIQYNVFLGLFKSMNYMSYFFTNHPVPCHFLYVPLKKDHIPMSCPVKNPPNFYREGNDFMGKEYKSVRFVMTKKKSKQIDKLFELVPSAEFEITYLRFSRILKEIRPIDGYEYPEGIKEICDKINKMYP